MFLNFVDELRAAGIPASMKEHLTLLDALDKDVIEQTPEAFYYLSRATFVKDEGLLDRFDQVFQKVFKGIFSDYGTATAELPEEWLRAIAEKYLTPEEMAKIESLGSWE
ncbi:MAG: VWA domain-containing protein, partial [Alphaproteobacteria bacterium]|nr:VWA domain-containing protein [Alphaproteobacteria bacterium]